MNFLKKYQVGFLRAIAMVLFACVFPVVQVQAQTPWTGNVGTAGYWVNVTVKYKHSMGVAPDNQKEYTTTHSFQGPVTRIWFQNESYNGYDSYDEHYNANCTTGRLDTNYGYVTVVSVVATNIRVPSYEPNYCPTTPPPPPPPPTGCTNGKTEEVSPSQVIKFNFAKLGVVPSKLTTLNKAVQKFLGEGTVKVIQGAGFLASQTSPIVVEPVVEILNKGEVKIDHKRDCCNSIWSNAYYMASGKLTLFTLGAKAKVKLPIPAYPALAVVGSREVSCETSFQGKPVTQCSTAGNTSRTNIKGELITGLKLETKLGIGDTVGIISGQGVVKSTLSWPIPVSINVDTANLVQGVTVDTKASQVVLYAEIGWENCIIDGGFCHYTKSLPLMDTRYDLLW